MRNTKVKIKLQFWKGLGYIATGMVLIIISLVFSGIAWTFLEPQPEINQIATDAVFWMVVITGTIWGSILIWKGVNSAFPPIRDNAPE